MRSLIEFVIFTACCLGLILIVFIAGRMEINVLIVVPALLIAGFLGYLVDEAAMTPYSH